MIFQNFKKISYDFSGVTQTILDLSSEYDVSVYDNSFYSIQIDNDLLLDKLSIDLYDDEKYYFSPIYTSNILNPFEEFPAPTKKIEDDLGIYYSIFGSFSGLCFEVGDLIVKNNNGYSAGFNPTTDFGYIVDIDNEINKLKILMVGSLATGSNTNTLLRKENSSWGEVSLALFTINQIQKFQTSPYGFVNSDGIFTKNQSVAGFTIGGTTSNYVPITEEQNLNFSKNILTVAKENVIKNIEDNINGIS